MDPMIIVAPIAHHTPTVTSRHSLNAVVSQSKNCWFWANTVIKLSVLVVILFSLIVVLTPNVQFVGCVTDAFSERCNDNFWVHMWNLLFWEVAYPLSESNFRCWSGGLWRLFVHYTHHGLNILLCIIHRPFCWGLGFKTGQSMQNLWWTKRF